MTGEKRQKIRRFFSAIAMPGARASSSNTPSTATSPLPVTLPQSSPSNPTKSKQERAMEAASSFQTLLAIVEKTLDGCPTWGPKAVVAVAGEVVRITRLKKENDDAIKRVQLEAQNLLDMSPEQEVDVELDELNTIPPELQKRIDKFRVEIESHLHDLDAYRAAKLPSQATKLSERIKDWLAIGAEVLAADAISNALPEVNRKISVSIQNFMFVGQIKGETMGFATYNRVVAMAEDMKAIREAQSESAKAKQGTEEYMDYERLLLKLTPTKTALHSAKGAARACHEGTRKEILHKVQTWFRDPESPSVLWLSGIAGTGKTTIAQSICEILELDLGASFMFSRDYTERQQPSNILPTIGYQLAYSRPVLRPAICEMLSKNPDFASKSTRVQAQELLFRALGSELTADCPITLLLLDALDECEKDNNLEGGDVIPLLLRFLRNYPARFKVVITSRPETSIRGMLGGGNDQADLFVLHEVDKNMVQSDIEAYLRHELSQIAINRGLREKAWPANIREEQVKQLARQADRLFIFAATAVKALSKSVSPSKMIQSLLANADRSNKSLHGPLDAMYLQVINTIITNDVDEQEAQDLVDCFQCIVGAIITINQPLSVSSLRQLLDVEDSQIYAVIGPLYAVLDVDDSLERPIQTFHLSFPDFLTDDTRCKDVRFHITREKSHLKLSVGCLRIMNERLEKDMCGIRDPSLLNAEVGDLAERCERCTSAALRYACLHWWAHLEHVKSATEELVKELEAFTSGKMLQWLELLSAMGHVRSALIGLPKATGWCRGIISACSLQGGEQGYGVKDSDSTSEKYPKMATRYENEKKTEETLWPSQELEHAAALLYDANRTTQAFFSPISESALQIYESALTFMPHCSLLSQSGELHSVRVTMTTRCRPQWSQELRVMEGHKGRIREIVASPNGLLLASCSDDKTIKVWDVASGAPLVHVDSDTYHLMFSPDSSKLLSLLKGSDVLQTWDAVSGDLLSTFTLVLDGKELGVTDVWRKTISPSCDFVAVGLENGDLCMLGTDGITTRLQGKIASERSVALSRDGLCVAPGSDGVTVWVWNVKTLICIATFHVESKYQVEKVDICSDGSRVVALAGSNGGRGSRKVWIWNTKTQRQLAAWEIQGRRLIRPRLLSVNKVSLVCAPAFTNTFIAYDIATGQQLSTYEGHTRNVQTAAFMPDGTCVVSGSEDSTIRVWDAQINTAVNPSFSEEHTETIRDLALSADGTRVVTVSEDKTVCCWEARSGRMTSKIKREAYNIGILSDGTAVGLNREGSTIKVWNAETAEDITTLRGHSRDVEDAAFSPDFIRLASGSWDRTVRIWNTATWECTATLTGHTSLVYCVCFSPDGSCVVSGSSDKTVRVWDAGTGDALAVLKGHTGWVKSVRFSSDGLSIVSKQPGGIEREWKAGVDFPLPTPPFPLPPVELDDSGWLFITPPTSHRRRLCWLPIERRGRTWSSGTTVALISAAGAMTILLTSDTVC